MMPIDGVVDRKGQTLTLNKLGLGLPSLGVHDNAAFCTATHTAMPTKKA